MTINEAQEYTKGLLEDAKASITEASGGYFKIVTDVFYFDEDANAFSEYNEKADTICGNLAVFLPNAEEDAEPIEYAFMLDVSGGTVLDGSGDGQINEFITDTEMLADSLRGKGEEDMLDVYAKEAERVDKLLEASAHALEEYATHFKHTGVRGIVITALLLILIIILSKLIG